MAELFFFTLFQNEVYSQLLLFLVFEPSSTPTPLTSYKVEGWEDMLKYKTMLVKYLNKCGLIAKLNSKHPFWRLRSKMESIIGLAVSRTSCPHLGWGGEREV